MSASHFDIVVLGSSPAARMAAALCAKGGCKVLLLDSNRPSPPPPWCHGCLHLDRLLESLGGRSCLQPTPPFQVHAGTTRLTVHGRRPLAAELLREHRLQQPQMLALLDSLDREGRQIEERLWDNDGLPLLGRRSRWRWCWNLLRRGRLPSSLHRPLASRLGALPPQARATLETLFAGLALAPAQLLSQAEAALLWHCAGRLEALQWESFDELLNKRFEQFHGKVEPVTALKECKRRPDGRFELALQGHQGASAAGLILGDLALISRLPAELRAALPAPPPYRRLAATLTQGRPSPLLAPGVLLDHPGGLRLALPSGKQENLTVEMGEKPDSNAAWLTRIQAALPFTRIAAQDVAFNEPVAAPPKSRRPAFPGAGASIRVAPGVLLADGEGVLPHLGLPGEAILATTLARHLLRAGKGRSR